MFNITNEQIKKLGDNLERVGVLERGKNNARILSIQDKNFIGEVLSRGSDSNDIHTPLLQTSPHSYNVYNVVKPQE